MPVLRADRRALREGAAAGRRAGRAVPARDGRDGEPRARARGGRRAGRAVRGEPALDAGRRRRGARRAATGSRCTRCTARTSTSTRRTSARSSPREPQITLDDGADLITRAARGAPGRRRARCSARPRRRRRASCGCARWRPRDGSRAPCSPSTRPAPSAPSTTATAPASRRSTASSARRTCCSPARRSSWSATAGPEPVSRCARTALGARVIVCEVDPIRALEARMAGFEVLPALEAAERGDIFITVTGGRDVLAARALRAHEGRRGARQRRPLRRRDRPRGAARGSRRRAARAPARRGVRRSAAGA